MGNKSSSNSLPEGIVQINRSLYLLPSLSSELQTPEYDVVCFHGLQPNDNMYKDAFWLTWSNDDGGHWSLSWPDSMLRLTCRHARIMSVSYDFLAQVTSKVGESHSQNIYEKLQDVGEKLIEDLVLDQDVALGVDRPLILIGHSLGGIVLKHFILHADFRKTQLQSGSERDVQSAKIVTGFLKNLAGVAYISTPHDAGSELAEFASKLSGESPVLHFLKMFAKETSRINENFQEWHQIIPTFSFFEYAPTKYKTLWNAVVVGTTPVWGYGKLAFGVEKDHFSICKMSSALSSSLYSRLYHFISDCVCESTENREPVQTAGMGAAGHGGTMGGVVN